MRWMALLGVALTGCALYGGGDDADPDALPACDTTRRAYLIDALDVPATSTEAEALGWDVDDDGRVDNQGGALIGSIDQALDVDLQGAVDDALAGGLVQIGVVIDECAAPSYARVSLARGAELDLSVTTEPAVARDGLPAAATGGVSQFPVGQLIHPFADRWIDAAALAMVVDEVRDDAVSGVLAAALDHDQAFDIVARGFQAKIVERNEEYGPCTVSSCEDVLETLYGVFDANEDYVITLPEIKENELFISLLQPDVDLDGDGTAEHLSIGVGFHASAMTLAREN